jgi:hypothetical protein
MCCCGVQVTNVTIAEKTCSQCNQTKPSSEFHRDPYQQHGLHNKCKLCIMTAKNASRRAARLLSVPVAEKACITCSQVRAMRSS